MFMIHQFLYKFLRFKENNSMIFILIASYKCFAQNGFQVVYKWEVKDDSMEFPIYSTQGMVAGFYVFAGLQQYSAEE